MEPKVKCRRCEREILERTARKTGGYCRICENWEEKEAAAQRQQEYMEWGRSPMTDFEFDAGLEIEDLEELVDFYFEKATWRALDSPLTYGETVVVAVESFFGQVTAEGMYSYLSEEYGGLAETLPDAFQRLGLDEWSQLAQEIRKLFSDGVPASNDKRREQLDAMAEENWYERLTERFYKLWNYPGTLDDCRARLREFIAENREEFVHA